MASFVGDRSGIATTEVHLRKATRRGKATVELVWSRFARLRLRQIRDYIARDKPEAAERLAIRIVAIAETLRRHPHLGRRGAERGMRELIVGGTPYVIIYKIQRSRVVIATVWHAVQQRKQE